ncbi:Uncharacterised protein [Mycolicibacterium gilvum]|uniref:Uncharacterized protein n=1 Tax=Mycolicibacterium gilvum TaxID=1804 RepID=A0A378SLF2_9MYCO|nr:Uncharacterised protein [Mycolicibacterium gilvum]
MWEGDFLDEFDDLRQHGEKHSTVGDPQGVEIADQSREAYRCPDVPNRVGPVAGGYAGKQLASRRRRRGDHNVDVDEDIDAGVLFAGRGGALCQLAQIPSTNANKPRR